MALGHKQFHPMFPSPSKVPKEMAIADFLLGLWCSICWIVRHKFSMIFVSSRGDSVRVIFIGLGAGVGLLSPGMLYLTFLGGLKNK
jgi:hypothetical protein